MIFSVMFLVLLPFLLNILLSFLKPRFFFLKCCDSLGSLLRAFLFFFFVRLDYLLELAENAGEKVILILSGFVWDLLVTLEESQVLLAVFASLGETIAYDAQDLIFALAFIEFICKLCTFDEIFPGPARFLSLLRFHTLIS